MQRRTLSGGCKKDLKNKTKIYIRNGNKKEKNTCIIENSVVLFDSCVNRDGPLLRVEEIHVKY